MLGEVLGNASLGLAAAIGQIRTRSLLVGKNGDVHLMFFHIGIACESQRSIYYMDLSFLGARLCIGEVVSNLALSTPRFC